MPNGQAQTPNLCTKRTGAAIKAAPVHSDDRTGLFMRRLPQRKFAVIVHPGIYVFIGSDEVAVTKKWFNSNFSG